MKLLLVLLVPVLLVLLVISPICAQYYLLALLRYLLMSVERACDRNLPEKNSATTAVLKHDVMVATCNSKVD